MCEILAKYVLCNDKYSEIWRVEIFSWFKHKNKRKWFMTHYTPITQIGEALVHHQRLFKKYMNKLDKVRITL